MKVVGRSGVVRGLSVSKVNVTVSVVVGAAQPRGQAGRTFQPPLYGVTAINQMVRC